MPAYELRFPTVRGAQNFERKEMPEQKRMGIVREWTREENIIKVDGEHIVPELYRRVYHAELGIAAPPDGNMVYVKNKKFTVKLDNLDDRDGAVMATVSGRGAGRWAKNDQSIGGSMWESDDENFAYAMPVDHPGLVAELEKEGYDLDLDDYSPPSMRANSGAPPGPQSGFGKEKTTEDIKARIAWERWAAKRAEAEGHRALRDGHMLAAVEYEKLLDQMKPNPQAKANHPPSAASNAITDSIARTLFVLDWVDRQEAKGRRLGPGNLFDKAPVTSVAAKRTANKIREYIEDDNRMSLDALFLKAMHDDGVDNPTTKDMESFGYYLTMEMLGHGVSWTDDHENHGVILRYIEYSNGDLSVGGIKRS